MNGLSILIWVASIASNLVAFLFGLTVIGIGIIAIANFFYAMHCDTTHDAKYSFLGKNWLILLVFIGFVSTLIPDKNAIYMIAASQIGETVITQPENAEVLNNVRELINSKLVEAISETKGE